MLLHYKILIKVFLDYSRDDSGDILVDVYFNQAIFLSVDILIVKYFIREMF